MKEKQEWIPIVTSRSVIPVRDYGDIGAKIDIALRETEQRSTKMRRAYWLKRIFHKGEGLDGRLYCLLRLMETFS
jgi:hypothetical protein